MVHVYVDTNEAKHPVNLESVTDAVEDHGCEVKEMAPGLYEVKVHDPNGDAEDEVTEWLNDAGIEAFVSYANPKGPKAFDLLVCGNLLSVVVKDGGGSIESGLPREVCPSCSEPDCNCSCDGSQGADDNNDESEDDVLGRLQYNAVLDAVESIVLAHAAGGIKVDDPKYVEGIETMLEAVGNNL